MYLGRIVAIGKNIDGENVGIYRISSRSYPNREIKILKDSGIVIPSEGFNQQDLINPYIRYNCIRVIDQYVVIANGNHCDYIADKIYCGSPLKDAVASVLLAMDYEKDQLDTPRIAGVVPIDKCNNFVLGIIRKDAIIVKEFIPKIGELFYIGTYNQNEPCKYIDNNFNAKDGEEAVNYILNGGPFANMDFPIDAAAVMVKNRTFKLSTTKKR